MNNKSLITLYIALLITALALLFSGIFLKSIIGFFNVKVADLYMNIAQIAFIISGIADIALIFYAKKQLS